MSNGEVCCILGICCPPEQQRAAIVRKLQTAGVTDEQVAEKAAGALMDDLNPRAILKAIGQKLES